MTPAAGTTRFSDAAPLRWTKSATARPIRGAVSRASKRELARNGLGPRDVVPNVNFFMRVPVADSGQVAIVDGISKPGDRVDLRADMDVLAVLSNCPEALNPATGGKPTPIQAIVYQPTRT